MRFLKFGIAMSGLCLFLVTGCGGGSSEDALEVEKVDFCALAKKAATPDLSLKKGEVDSVKLYYANQVGMSTSIAINAPAAISEVAKNLQMGTIELYKLLESFNFSFAKMSESPSAVSRIEDISNKYSLEKSDISLKKYLQDKCGITAQEQGVPTTIS